MTARKKNDRSTGDLVDDLFAALKGKDYVDGAIIVPRMNGKYPREWKFICKSACRGRKITAWKKLNALIKQGGSPVGVVLIDPRGFFSVMPFDEYKGDETLYGWLNLLATILGEYRSQGIPDELLLPDDTTTVM